MVYTIHVYTGTDHVNLHNIIIFGYTYSGKLFDSVELGPTCFIACKIACMRPFVEAERLSWFAYSPCNIT